MLAIQRFRASKPGAEAFRPRPAAHLRHRSRYSSLRFTDQSGDGLADDELKEIIRHQLARYDAQPGFDGRLSWGATDAGRAIAQRIGQRAL
jgi:hypothetical protein